MQRLCCCGGGIRARGTWVCQRHWHNSFAWYLCCCCDMHSFNHCSWFCIKKLLEEFNLEVASWGNKTQALFDMCCHAFVCTTQWWVMFWPVLRNCGYILLFVWENTSSTPQRDASLVRVKCFPCEKIPKHCTTDSLWRLLIGNGA